MQEKSALSISGGKDPDVYTLEDGELNWHGLPSVLINSFIKYVEGEHEKHLHAKYWGTKYRPKKRGWRDTFRKVAKVERVSNGGGLPYFIITLDNGEGVKLACILSLVTVFFEDGHQYKFSGICPKGLNRKMWWAIIEYQEVHKPKARMGKAEEIFGQKEEA